MLFIWTKTLENKINECKYWLESIEVSGDYKKKKECK